MEWRRSVSPRPKKFECKNPLERFRLYCLGDQDGTLLIDYLPKGQIINAEYYSYLLVQLRDILKEKRLGKVTKWVVFLQDNSPTHRALAIQKKLACLASNVLITHPILQMCPRRNTTCSLD